MATDELLPSIAEDSFTEEPLIPQSPSSPSDPHHQVHFELEMDNFLDENNLSPAERVRNILKDQDDEETEILCEQLSIHALFCQLDVLCHFDGDETGWKEAARWLKYEEKVESGNRWSKPHVATVSLHSLIEVKNSILKDTVVLDLVASHGCLHQVAEQISAEIAKTKGLSSEKETLLCETLLRPHKHLHRGGDKKNHNQENGFNNDNGKGGLKINITLNHSKSVDEEDQISSLQHTYPGGILPEQLLPYKPNKKLMRKIPGGSEAANILVGLVDFIDEPLYAFCRLSKPAVLADLTEVAIPTRFIFIALGSKNGDASKLMEMVEVGRATATLLTDRVFCEVAYKAIKRNDIADGIDEYLDDLTCLPPSIWDPSTRLEPPEKTITLEKIHARLTDESRHCPKEEAFHFSESAGEDVNLRRTGRIFGGMIDDIKRKLPHYWSDIRDGFNLQCLATTLFLYFACITPVITFGGLLSAATHDNMGIMETILGTAICGIVYVLLAGQPLTIMGTTGPMLVFESILYKLCADQEWDFMSFRLYIGIWITAMLLIIVIFDISALVKYITRFTEESFGVLISVIFIQESFVKLFQIWNTHPIHIHSIQEESKYKCHCKHPPEDFPYNLLTIANTNTEIMTTTLIENSTTPNPVYQAKDHPIFEIFNWTGLVYEDCITYQNRIVVHSGCITEANCTEHGWILEGPACNIHTVTHSVPDVFFLCCFLFIGTTVIALSFRKLKTSSFFPSRFRGVLSDFAVLLAILFCTFVDFELGLDTPKLKVPGEFKNTNPNRTWLIDPTKITYWWLILVAILPAALATILIFLDQQITGVIVNKKENKLKKGSGYHLDLFIVAILILLCSFLGLPWFVAATVRSVTHVRSLIKESELRAPGEKAQFLGVREQRITGLLIHILVAVSIFLTPILKYIPMAVLYGIFLFMGLTSLQGVQFVQRVKILLMPSKYQPDYMFLRHVSTHRVHLFTALQLFCMGIMYVFKSIKKISIVFPLLILALVFVRVAMNWLFSQSELYWLDHILPENIRRDAEDKEKGDGDITIDIDGREKMISEKDDEWAHENGLNKPILSDDNDEWDELTACRDYGVGRISRPRRLSHDVIRRYSTRSKKSKTDLTNETIQEDSSETEGDDDYKSALEKSLPFRHRKFSM